MHRLALHRPGVLVTEMKLDPGLYDAPAPWRDTAVAGVLHSGEPIHHPRSTSETCF